MQASTDVVVKTKKKKKKIKKNVKHVTFADDVKNRKKHKKLPKSPKARIETASAPQPSTLCVPETLDFPDSPRTNARIALLQFSEPAPMETTLSMPVSPIDTPMSVFEFKEAPSEMKHPQTEFKFPLEKKQPPPESTFHVPPKAFTLSQQMSQLSVQESKGNSLDSFVPAVRYVGQPTPKPKPPPELSPPNKYGVALNKPFQHKPAQLYLLDQVKERDVVDNHGMRGAVLVAEMGLGKTVMSFSLVMGDIYEWEHNGRIGPRPVSVFVCKKNLIGNAQKEIKKFFGDRLKYFVLHPEHNTKATIDQLNQSTIHNYDVIITTYEHVKGVAARTKCAAQVAQTRKGQMEYHKAMKPMLQNQTGSKVLLSTHFKRVIADETQTLINPKSKVFQGMLCLCGDSTVALSGTPIKNSPVDIWAHAMFLGFNAERSPNKWTEEKYVKFNIGYNILQMDYAEAKIPRPPKYEQVLEIDFTPEEQILYNRFEQKTKDALADMGKRGVTYTHVLTGILRCRQICLAACLVPLLDDDGSDEVQQINRWLLDPRGTAAARASKVVAICNYIVTRVPLDEKVLVFAGFVPFLHLLQAELKRDGIVAVILHGEMKPHEREEAIRSFQEDPEVRVFISTFEMAAAGLNMIEATRVMLVSQWWNRVPEDQAIARSWRQGQTRDVHVVTVIHKGSIEVKMRKRCQDKSAMVDRILNSDKPTLEMIQSLFT